MAPPRREVGIALSGGGHRASLMALGALIYVVDAKVNEEVGTIASVSGGTIANAFVAQECDFRTVTCEDFDHVAGKLAKALVHRGVLDATLVGKLYVLVLLAVGAVALCSFSRWSTIYLPWWACPLSVALFGLLATFRGTVFEHILGTVLFRKRGRPTRLGRIEGQTQHVFCATDLTHANPFYFVTRYNGELRNIGFLPQGGGHLRNLVAVAAPEVTLEAAVRASAGFPGAFPPRRFGFTLLADGGIWDNLGTQWWDLDRDLHDLSRGYDLNDLGVRRNIDRLLVIEAGLPLQSASNWLIRLPVVGELLTLSRVVSVLYPNVVKPRVEALRSRLDRWADEDGKQFVGPAVVTLSEGIGRFSRRQCSSKAVLEYLTLKEQVAQEGIDCSALSDKLRTSTPHTRRGELDRRALLFLNDTIPVWTAALPSFGYGSLSELEKEALSVPTTLSRVNETKAISLIVYGYLAAMEALHVSFGTPLRPPLAPRRLQNLVARS
jgi:Patatin-like phospholipase